MAKLTHKETSNVTNNPIFNMASLAQPPHTLSLPLKLALLINMHYIESDIIGIQWTLLAKEKAVQSKSRELNSTNY